MTSKTRLAAFALPVVAAALVATSSPAFAASIDDRDGPSRSGSCSQSSNWELKAKSDDGGIEVEFEVDSNVSGQVWNVTLTDNGKSIFKGQQTTGGASGSFSLERTVQNLPGKDKFVGKAKNPDTGETCTGKLTF